eukprot:TRINITY_DN13983_c0_g1_i1.p1 TRINITY_DN13983_c0_g1~~TRINITY_DN13983_c0_g1_i1.p1  ORF type:complete len:315 (+),score=48.28 TRINITY_DN13983_c0_g1_i1:107-1051(+)
MSSSPSVDALRVARKELAIFRDTRKIGLVEPLLSFYSKPVWCTPFHGILDESSRRLIRLIFFVAKKVGLTTEQAMMIACCTPVVISPEVTLDQRQRSADGHMFSLRPRDDTRTLYVRTQMIPVELIPTLFAGFGEISVNALQSAAGVTEYEVTFTSKEYLLQAACLNHPKIYFTGFKNPEAPTYCAQELAELNMMLGQEKWVMPLLVDNLPYWTTADQITHIFSEHGTVREVRFAINDLNGCHYGCCQVLMSSQKEMQKAEAAIDGKRINGSICVVGLLGKDGVIRSSKGTTPKSMGGEQTLTQLNFPVHTESR